jgi:hypothetical protein
VWALRPQLKRDPLGRQPESLHNVALHPTVHRLRSVIASLILGGGSLLASECQDVRTTWSAELLSPDGYWLATARSQSWGGPGTASVATTVFLKQGSQSPVEVLDFSHQDSTMTIKMRWLTPRHLDVTYAPLPGDSATLDFQVVRIAGIEVSVHRAPPASSK